MKRALILLIIMASAVTAQLPWDVTDLRCGNNIVDKYEMCEKGNDTKCDQMGEMLGIATACWTDHCTCLPKINSAFCGNGNFEGAELCDGEVNKCPELGLILGVNLTCNKDTCGCNFAETIPDSYDPSYVQKLINLTTQPSECGNKKVEGTEDCDPPNSLCETNTKQAGTCSATCECEATESIGVKETIETNTTNETINETTQNETIVNETTEEIIEQEEPKEPGFFTKLWQWFASLFE